MFSLNPHEYRIVSAGVGQLVRLNPYTRVSRQVVEGQTENIYLQGGEFFSEGGERLEKPDWIDGEIAKMTQKAREEVGFGDWVRPVGLAAPNGKLSHRSSVESVSAPSIEEITAAVMAKIKEDYDLVPKKKPDEGDDPEEA